MAKAKSVTPQSKPAVAAKKNVKARQAAVKAETKKSVPKKVCLTLVASEVLLLFSAADTRPAGMSCRLRPAAVRKSPQATRMKLQ